MNPEHAIAQTAATDQLGHTLWVLLLTFGGTSMLLSLIFIGAWNKFALPAIRKFVKEFLTESEQTEALERRIEHHTRQHEGTQEFRDAFHTNVVRVIDDQVNRMDGVIRREIAKQVIDHHDNLSDTLEVFRRDILENRQSTERILSQLNQIQGQMSTLLAVMKVGPSVRKIDQ